MGALLKEVVMNKPVDPVQFMVDFLTLDPDQAGP